MNIRAATPGDAIAIAEINRLSLGYENTAEDIHSRLATLVASPDHRVLVAEQNGSVFAYTHACRYDALFAPAAVELVTLAVLPGHQGSGTGKALLHAVEAWAQIIGTPFVRLLSGAQREDAHAFYRAQGYISDGTKQKFVKQL